MEIDVCIPFNSNKNLAEAYNRALKQGTSEWVLFLDHDVFLCNPLWYTMCQTAIEQLKSDPQVACITCMAGGETDQKGDYRPMEYHIQSAMVRYKMYGNQLEQIHEHAAGFFLLLNRRIATEIGFIQQRKNNINKIDTDFGNRLLKAGYHIYRMPGLYVYHRRGLRKLKKKFDG